MGLYAVSSSLELTLEYIEERLDTILSRSSYPSVK